MKRTPYLVRSGLPCALLLVAAAACGPDQVPAAAPASAYVADLSDDRLVAAGKFACQARTDGLDEAGFVLLLMKNPQTEEGIKPVLNLLWDEATTTLCPK